MASNDIISLLRAQLAEYIPQRFAADASFDAIRDGVLSDPALAGIDRGQLIAALDGVLSERPEHKDAPRLLVDWGELPQIGRTARPLFSLIAPGAAARPSVKITVDRGLDNNQSDPLRQLRTEESGLWTFYVPFSLTTGGFDARPGLYVIDVEVTFPHGDHGHPRFLQTRIRLNVPDGNSGRRELVIDGDGQSVVNLAGHDLRSFSRVVLKGDDKSIINLQNFSKDLEFLPQTPKEQAVFEYELKVNRDIHGRLPRLVTLGNPTKTDALTLSVDGRRIHVIARKRVTFGRNRENDVCLRFLPRSQAHDEGSRGLSRTHMALDLTDDGVVLTDENSSKGIDVDCDPVRGEKTFTHLDAHGGRRIDVPSALTASQVLEMDLMLFARAPDDPEFAADLAWDDVCFDIAGEPASRLWQVSRGCGIEAIRLRRLSNLPEEEYVFLFRHATIGKSAKDHPVSIAGIAGNAGELRFLYAGRTFWIHSGGRTPLEVDDRPVKGACLIPLAVGQRVRLAGVEILVSRFSQLHLDDEGASPGPLAPASDKRLAGGDAGLPEAAPASPLRPKPEASPPVAPMRSPSGPPLAPPLPPPLPGGGHAAVRGTPASNDSISASTDPVRRALASTAVITAPDGHGSGFLGARGIVVTNYHVVADSPIADLRIAFPDGDACEEEFVPVGLLHEDPTHDLAFLRIATDRAPLAPGSGFRHRNGHRIVAIGSPGVGAAGQRLENLATDGRLGPEYAGNPESPVLWSLSMAVNPGNSGGPVIDAETGEVVAVVVARFLDTDGHSLAVPFKAFWGGLEIARGADSSGSLEALSLHRQRLCRRAITQLLERIEAASAALFDEIEQPDLSVADFVHNAVNTFTNECGIALATELESLKPTVVAELTALRGDGQCPADRCALLERAWGGIERLCRQLSAEVGRLEIDIFVDEVRSAVNRVRKALDTIGDLANRDQTPE